MRQLRICMQLHTSYITPFHADTIFGHLCWAIAELEGETAVQGFLQAFKNKPPLLVSDGFPQLKGTLYLPYPELPAEERGKMRRALQIAENDKKEIRLFASAYKKVSKSAVVAANVLANVQNRITCETLPGYLFNLVLCPKSMQVRDARCQCQSWRKCCYLNPDSAISETPFCREISRPTVQSSEVLHNSINRINSAAENLYTQQELTVNYDIAFLVTIDEAEFSYERLTACMEYLRQNGYGKNRSTGKGAIARYAIDDYELAVPTGANAFISLSSAYVPQEGEIGETAWYQPYVKYGKLGGGMATVDNPFKRPLMMLRDGAVIGGQPDKHYGALIADIHWEFPHVVQYGYAFPLWIKLEVENA